MSDFSLDTAAASPNPAGSDTLMAMQGKIALDQTRLNRIWDELARPIVFTNGVFDILHRGHVTYLALASALGATLVVAINSDASVRMLGKGEARPCNPMEDRALVLAALSSVDVVTCFAERTPCSLIERLKPEIYVKGGDYDIEALEETRLIRSWGGTALALPFVDGHSTTATLARLSRGRPSGTGSSNP